MTQVLKGVRVVEHGTFITGPAAAMVLADMGAEVVKVELPGTGDPFRAFKGGLYSPHYQTYNRNKHSVALDTRKPEDRATFDRLIEGADIYIQNFRPGFAEQIHAGEARLRELNPRLIYCAISGFGPDGPSASRPSYDTVAQAASGFLRLLVNPENPRVVGPAIADAMTGYYAAFGILGALHARHASGEGRRVDVSMFEAMTHFNLDAFTHLFSVDEVMGPYSRPSVSQSYVLECACGGWIALHMSSPEKFWQGLAQAMDKPDIFEDERFCDRFARITHQDALIVVLRDIFKRRPRSEWCERLLAQDVPHAPMYRTDEVPEDPQAQHLQLFVDMQHPTMGPSRTVRSPISFDGQRNLRVTPPPTLGEHNALYAQGWPEAAR